jgi:hypothetical protein
MYRSAAAQSARMLPAAAVFGRQFLGRSWAAATKLARGLRTLPATPLGSPRFQLKTGFTTAQRQVWWAQAPAQLRTMSILAVRSV